MKMTTNGDSSPEDLPPLTSKQQDFVHALLRGKTAADAYREAYNTENMSNAAVWVEASRLPRNTKITLSLSLPTDWVDTASSQGKRISLAKGVLADTPIRNKHPSPLIGEIGARERRRLFSQKKSRRRAMVNLVGFDAAGTLKLGKWVLASFKPAQ
jgi:hypothetical protein